MEQRIFEMNLSVEGISLYLLMASLADGGADLTRDVVSRIWNSGPDELDAAFSELTARQVIETEAAGYRLLPVSEWKEE